MKKIRIDATGMRCSECEATPAKLLVFYTMRGAKRLTHNGEFCSKHCHDIFYGLKADGMDQINILPGAYDAMDEGEL
jgi:hypothetical protein